MLTCMFIDGKRGRLFCTLRVPEVGWRGPAVMVVPAFGDEMNMTRRMLTATGTLLAEAGIALIIPDLYGTGDSEGRFEEAAWSTWLDDCDAVLEWARNLGLDVQGVLAIRAGALLAAQFIGRSMSPELKATVCWQPVEAGTIWLKQMLRMRALGSAVGMGVRETVDGLLEQIDGGAHIVVGGYALSKQLVDPLKAATLAELVSKKLGRLTVIDVRRTSESASDCIEEIGGVQAVRVRRVGEPYWSATEIVCDLGIVERTVAEFEAAILG